MGFISFKHFVKTALLSLRYSAPQSMCYNCAALQFADGVYLVLLMGLLEGYFVPLYNFFLTPENFDQKVKWDYFSSSEKRFLSGKGSSVWLLAAFLMEDRRYSADVKKVAKCKQKCSQVATALLT